MAIYAEDGTTTLINNNLTEIHGPVTGVVSFDANGQAHTAGSALAAIHVPLAESLCANYSCSLQRCVVGTVDEIARQVKCDGFNLWEWPTGVTLSDQQWSPNETDATLARRQLKGCSKFDPYTYDGTVEDCKSQCASTFHTAIDYPCKLSCETNCEIAYVHQICEKQDSDDSSARHKCELSDDLKLRDVQDTAILDG